MKKYCIAGLILLASCGSGNEIKQDAASATSDPSSNPDYQKGLELVAKSDCFTCHKVSEKLTGPAYQDVAAKYPATDDNINLLADKIISGGQGVWGPVPMLPHAQVSKADAQQMVKYILLLKKR